MTTYVYVLTKDKGVYGVFPTEQAAKDKVVQLITSNWYAYGDLMLDVAAAKYQISRQTMAEGVTTMTQIRMQMTTDIDNGVTLSLMTDESDERITITLRDTDQGVEQRVTTRN
jgi:hypothetical protein